MTSLLAKVIWLDLVLWLKQHVKAKILHVDKDFFTLLYFKEIKNFP